MSGIPSDLVDSRHLRRSVGQFVTGVTVVTYDLDGSPRLRGAVAWIECEPYAEVEAGDHILFLARVMSYRTLSKEPLLFHTGRFRLIGDALGSQLAADANVLAWQLISQAQTLAEDGVPSPDPTT
jgi:flavin reductase (DIM6/NTAB) family NADH-FMN oxidoreductase RutF